MAKDQGLQSNGVVTDGEKNRMKKRNERKGKSIAKMSIAQACTSLMVLVATTDIEKVSRIYWIIFTPHSTHWSVNWISDAFIYV